MFGKGRERNRKIEEKNIKVETEKFKVDTSLDIARKKVKDVPSDFFQVVTASSLERSQFSGNQSVKNNLALPSQSKVVKTIEEKGRKRNYKRRKSLFNSG